MPSLESAQQLLECPSQETLAGFNLGKLTAPEEEAVGNHLADCPRCESVLQQLNEGTPGDTFVDNLKRCFCSEPLLDEPGCADLQSFARGLLVELTDPGLYTAAFEVRPTREQPWIGRRIGNYHILAAIGHGGMGMVYRARQESVNRLVALKMVQAGLFAKPHSVRRFHTEGKAIARLRHPHVVQIYDFGQHEGMPYYSMELLEGGTLAGRFGKGPLEPRAAANIVAQLAAAVAFAHQNKVLHRDLKPGNVLLTADDTPKISDFGLAKLLDLEEGQTRSEEILGTPTYMAPEQARGGADKIGPAADIYALGVILYEALTGRPPYRGSDKHETLKLVLTGELVPPSKRRKGLHPDLEAICVKCLEREPARRYASAGALAEDLGHWLKGEPTEARPPRWPARLWRRVKRHKVASALAIGMALALAAVSHLDPGRNIREVQAELAKGNAVTLIAAIDSQPWYRVLKGQETSQISTADDGFFSVHSWDDCLVELLPDPMNESYRISAEVRHEKSNLPGWAGIFFGYHLQTSVTGECHAFMEMKFNDVRSISELFHLAPPHLKLVHKGNRARVGGRFLHAREKTFDPEAACFAGPPFPPTGANPMAAQRPWRHLEILVTPETIGACWNGASIGKMAPTKVLANIETLLQANRQHERAGPLAQGLTSRIEPRGSIGLFVSRSSVSFRNVSIVPLQGPAID